MPTRRAAAANRRQAHHQQRLARAGTDRARLRTACAWLVAEAVRADRLGDATAMVVALVHALRDGPPATDRVFDSMVESSPPGHNEHG